MPPGGPRSSVLGPRSFGPSVLRSFGQERIEGHGALKGLVRMFIGVALAALVVGYLAGLLSFKVKDRWCPHCGATTRELADQHAGHAR